MKINEKSTGNQSGFTLLEVLAASFILLTGLLTIGAAFGQGMKILSQLPLQMIAKEKMVEALDNITARLENGAISPVDTTDVTEQLTDVVVLGNGKSIDLRALDFRRSIHVTPVANVWEVKIDVSYTVAGHRKAHTQTVQVRRN